MKNEDPLIVFGNAFSARASAIASVHKNEIGEGVVRLRGEGPAGPFVVLTGETYVHVIDTLRAFGVAKYA